MIHQNKKDTVFQPSYVDLQMQNLIVFSHLRWDFVYQRPQHIMERLSKYFNIIFIEEPINFSDNGKTANIYRANDNLIVVQPLASWANFTHQLTNNINNYNEVNYNNAPLLWFYSPAFSSVIKNIKHSLVIYDCMDELSNFKGASPLLKIQEKYLLSKADIVFTGGKSLY
jgi:hypothetical protein